MDSPGAPSSSRLSPFKTYREFVADQRDDADPQAFARRYGEYRGGFARESRRAVAEAWKAASEVSLSFSIAA